jgi:hypothetical protein
MGYWLLVVLVMGLSPSVWAIDLGKYSDLKAKGKVSLEVVKDAEGAPVLDTETGEKLVHLSKPRYDPESGELLGYAFEDEMTKSSYVAYLDAKLNECSLRCASIAEAKADTEKQ